MTEIQTKGVCRGMRDLRTAGTVHIRSKPALDGQRYLDLYLLHRDRSRWKRMKDRAERSLDGIDKTLVRLGFSPDGGERGQFSPSKGRTAGTAGGPAKGRKAALRRRRPA